MSYCASRFQTIRRVTHEVLIGSVGVGGANPIRIQSMTTSDTEDVDATVRQALETGCQKLDMPCIAALDPLTSSLSRRRSETKAEALERDLDKAREIQRSILPAHELKFGMYDLYGISISERIVGGDFFDYLQASDDKDRLGVVIGDAASKGLSAAAQALYVSGALRMGVEFQTKMSSLIGRLNRMVGKTFTPEHFISMVYAEFTDSENGLVSYVNAGHSNPILLRAATTETETLSATGQIIGPFPQEKYRTEFTIMQRGDILLMYTDGISEATNDNREMYGEQRLIQKLQENQHRSPREICQLIIEEVQIHDRVTDYSDDKTLVVIKRSR